MNIVDRAWQSFRRIADAWDHFWFDPQDPLSLGVLRALVGWMMLYSHLVWGVELEGFFGPSGWQSAEAVRGFFADDWFASFWWYVPVEQLRLVHLLCIVPLLMFMLGWLTPWSSVLALVITISNSNRAPLANYGMDQILALLGLYLVIGGSGGAFSIDAWRRRRSGLPRVKTPQARLGTRLIQVHFCIIYFFAGISKLQGDAWWNGEAVWMAFANQEYQSIDMTWLAHYPWICQLATHATILWEIAFPFLIWNPALRPLMLWGGVGMHAGIGLCMGMITFGSIMIFGYLAFVSPEATQRVLDRVSRWHTVRRRLPSQPPPLRVIPPPVCEIAPSSKAMGNFGSVPRPVAVCDPEWKHRDFAHYLARRGYRPFVCATPRKLWQHVEQHELCGAMIFIDRLTRADFELLLGDLTLSPVSALPVVIVSQRRSRLRAVANANLPHVRSIPLPQPFRSMRETFEALLVNVLPEASAREGHAGWVEDVAAPAPTFQSVSSNAGTSK